MTTQLTMVGTNHRRKMSRIWIEGSRLAQCGFTVGARYNRACFDNCIRLVLAKDGKYKVSGKKDKPIIDITGKVVRDLFPESGDDTSRQVARVAYLYGIIRIDHPEPEKS